MRYLYLHGFASGPLSRKAQFFSQKLAEAGISLEIPALDEGDFEHLTITRQLDLITRILAGQPAVLIGSSMGGYLAALYASRHPEVDRMILLAPAFGFGERWDEVFGAEQVGAWRTRGYADVYHYSAGGLQRLSADLLHDSAAHPAYPRCSQPALIFHGLEDNVVPISAAESWVRANPNSRLVRMNSGHELTDVLEPIWEQCAAFCLRDVTL